MKPRKPRGSALNAVMIFNLGGLEIGFATIANIPILGLQEYQHLSQMDVRLQRHLMICMGVDILRSTSPAPLLDRRHTP